MGAPAEIISEIEEMNKPAFFEVWQENWETVNLFLRLQTQWKIGAMGGFIGLDYSSLHFLFKLYLIQDEKECFENIQTMEFAALEVLNQKGD